jgi:TonB-linked SusC/RagA family outer membrane protein
MKFITILLFTAFAISAINSYSQQTSFTLEVDSASVNRIFHHIEENSNFILLYSEQCVDLERKVNIHIRDQPVDTLLKLILQGTSHAYKIYDRQIVIFNNEASRITSDLTNSIDRFQRIVSGNVTAENGEPVPGVSVLLRGSALGTITDIHGNFQIAVPESANTLQFSHVSMKQEVVDLEGRLYLAVVMEKEITSLGEVIAIGYGSQDKKDVTGSISTIKSEVLLNNSPVDILGGMQGKVAGVYISSGSGDPGTGVDITIRGYNSISAGTSPLFVIDGMPYDINTDELAAPTIGNGNASNPLSILNPMDIESISVLKDASASAIYGSRGANGVIIVETRIGKTDKSAIHLSTSFGIAAPSNKLDVLNGNDFIEYRRDVDPDGYLFFENEDPDLPLDPYELAQHDWQNEILNIGFRQTYDLSMSGKTDKTNYYFSLGYLDNEAIVQGNTQKRYTMRMKVDHQISKKLYTGLTLNSTYYELNGVSLSGGGSDLFNGVVQNLVVSTPIEFYNPIFDPGDAYISPAFMLDDSYYKSATVDLHNNVFLNYAIVNGLKLELNGGFGVTSSKGSEFYGKETYWGLIDNGYSSIGEANTYSLNGSAQLHYSKWFKKNHHLKAMIAAETNVYNYEWFGVTNTDFLDESTGVFDISKGSTTKNSGSFRDYSRRVSFFSRLHYMFREKHLLTTTLRVDGSDKFGPGSRYGFFPSVAYSWLMIEEGFMQNQYVFSNFKIRLSYGWSGNDRIPSYSYLARLENSYYNGELGMAASSQANDDLKWESTYQSNLGIDLGFLDNLLALTIDLYYKQTNDMLIPTPIAGRTGYYQQWKNIGRIDNKGIEIQLSTTNICKNDFKWLTDFNISHNENRIVDLGIIDFIPVYITGAWIQDVGRAIVGGSLGAAYGYVFDGIYQVDEFTWQGGSDPSIPHEERVYMLKEGIVSIGDVHVRPGAHKFLDLNGDNEINPDDDRRAISSSQPLFFGGLRNSFQYGNFNLNLFLEVSYGNEIFNESKFRLEGGIINSYMNVSQEFYDKHWSLENPSQTFGNYADMNPTSIFASDYYVEDASYLRINSISLAYNFHFKALEKLNISKARIFLSGNNLYTWTRYSGFDPEVNTGNLLLTGVDRISYPRSRTVLIGIDITF